MCIYIYLYQPEYLECRLFMHLFRRLKSEFRAWNHQWSWRWTIRNRGRVETLWVFCHFVFLINSLKASYNCQIPPSIDDPMMWISDPEAKASDTIKYPVLSVSKTSLLLPWLVRNRYSSLMGSIRTARGLRTPQGHRAIEMWGEILATEELTNDVWWVLNSIDRFSHMALSVRFLGKNTPKSTVVVIIFHHFTTWYCLFGVYGTRFLDPDIFWTSATRPQNLRILCWNIHHELVPSPMNSRTARPGPERCHQGGHRTWHHRALRRRGWVSGWKWHGTEFFFDLPPCQALVPLASGKPVALGCASPSTGESRCVAPSLESYEFYIVRITIKPAMKPEKDASHLPLS